MLCSKSTFGKFGLSGVNEKSQLNSLNNVMASVQYSWRNAIGPFLDVNFYCKQFLIIEYLLF